MTEVRMSRIVLGANALFRVPSEELDGLYAHAGLVGVWFASFGGRSPAYLSADKMGKWVTMLKESKGISSEGAAALHADLEVLVKDHGLAATVNEVFERLAAKADASENNSFALEICDCGQPILGVHAYIVDGQSGKCAATAPYLARDALLRDLQRWVDDGSMTPGNACSILAQAAGLPVQIDDHVPPAVRDALESLFGRDMVAGMQVVRLGSISADELPPGGSRRSSPGPRVAAASTASPT